MEPLLSAELNDPQAEAVAHVNGPLLVFAGAGSGKTRVITYRIANLVACAGVPPYRILAVTFTNKAAGEMRARLAKLLGEGMAHDLWVGTFHATCAKLLRVHGAAIGVARNFTIYDGADQKAVVTRVLRELELDERRYPPRAMLARIHKEKQEGRGPDDMALDSYMDEAAHKVYVRYEAHLRAANAVDFEDLIVLTTKLAEHPREGGQLRRRFEYVLVDEFQDTNATQYRLLRALTEGHRNLCVVGDDDQSIYRWRGADVRNIRGFRKDFPDATVIKLEQNYRSSARIVSAALGVIAPSREREPKDLWTSNEDGEPIDVVAVKDERDEAAYVVRMLEEARREGTDLRDTAVFYRIHAQSRVLEEALRAANIPYQIVGGTKFYERAEIKDAIAYLRVLVNPRSDVDLLRIINVPARGIGATTIDRVTTFSTFGSMSVSDALERVDAIPELGPQPKKKLGMVRDLLARLRKEAETAQPSAVLRSVLDETGYVEALRKENTAEADARIENLEELAGSMHDFEAEAEAAGEAPTLEGYLERVSLQSDVDGMRDASRVTLMTVHGAKGLEFDLVLLTGMEEEMFPYRGLEPGGDDELEEERRLAYVAITRARKKLVLTHAEMRQIFGTTRWGRPSRFLTDLPSEHIEQKTSQARGVRAPRFVDRGFGAAAHGFGGGAPAGLGPFGASGARGTAWRHPQGAFESDERPPDDNGDTDARGGRNIAGFGDLPKRPPIDPGERYVDRSFFDDVGGGDDMPLREGSRVVHPRFGTGEVKRVDHAAEPRVVAFFPGWGEKTILARFLKLS
jgi:DNA helicase-2/ATP-dependent DNA helicase PcrA